MLTLIHCYLYNELDSSFYGIQLNRGKKKQTNTPVILAKDCQVTVTYSRYDMKTVHSDTPATQTKTVYIACPRKHELGSTVKRKQAQTN